MSIVLFTAGVHRAHSRALSEKIPPFTCALYAASRAERTTQSSSFFMFWYALYGRQTRPSQGNASGTRLAEPVHLCNADLSAMLRTYSIPAGSTRRAMVDHDLAHIKRVLLRASDDVLEPERPSL
jgi:hypothetical protein